MSQITQRFQNIFQLQNHYFEIIGCGAIGSYTAMNLARAGATNFMLWDPDTVDPVNIGVQHYDLTHIGNSKVKMLRKQINAINPNCDIKMLRQKFDPSHRTPFYYTRWTNELQNAEDEKKYFVIIGIDNMEGRKDIVNKIVSYYKHNDKVKNSNLYVIDARMGSETFQMYQWQIVPSIDQQRIYQKYLRKYAEIGTEGQYWNARQECKQDYYDEKESFLEAFKEDYLTKWYSDEDGDSEPCNARSTNYCASMAGAFINNQIRKLVDSSSPSNTNLVFNFPSMMIKCDTNYNLAS